MPAAFATATRAQLVVAGWRLIEVPAGLTLAGLRAAGAPFKSGKYFSQHALNACEAAFPGGEIAYRPGLMPDSLNQPYGRAQELAAGLVRLLPDGTQATVAPAALYTWLLWEHHRQHGDWLLRQCYTWSLDEWRDTHLIVGAMGMERPLIVSPLPEGYGRGVGLMPVIVPG